MIFARQRELLALLDALGGDVASTDFQKLLFLYGQERGEEAPYEFVPYQFGAFSFSSYADKRKLIDSGELARVEDRWVLTNVGAKVLQRNPFRSIAANFARRNAGLRGDALVAETYRKFPFFAIRSEIVERVLRGDEGALEAVRAAKMRPARAGLFTIGYEGLSLEAYLVRLLRAGVGLLCDVRRNPLSRKYGFSRSTLSRAVENVGIRYEHIPELGVASHDRAELNSPEAYERLFEAYRRDTLPQQEEALKTILQWVDEGMAVALTCFEASAKLCHRGCVASHLEARFGAVLASTHL
mgnify:CR=1 FL=1